MLDIEEMFPNQ